MKKRMKEIAEHGSLKADNKRGPNFDIILELYLLKVICNNNKWLLGQLID